MRLACWRTLLLVACALVFVFALHAKVAVYWQATQPHASTSSKLSLNGEKLQPQAVGPVISIFWLAAFVVCLFNRQPELRYQAVYETAAPPPREHLYLHRFLRPPPLQ